MIHQPIELGIPSAAKARLRRVDSKPTAAVPARDEAAERSTLLLAAIDEAFAALPHPASDEKQPGDPDCEQVSELGHHTVSLAEMLGSQLKELDLQRERLAQLLAQIGDRTLADHTAELATLR